MKNSLTIIVTSLLLLLTACGAQKPLTESEQAANYNMTISQYREEKIAAARMNMTFEEHLKMKAEEGSMKSGEKMGM